MHSNHHHSNSRHKCDICERMYYSRRTLKMHIESNHTDRNRCKVCNKNFSHRYKLDRHVSVIHEYDPKNRQICNLCNKIFKTKDTLSAHMSRTHSGETSNPYSCEICGKEFRLKLYLQNHVRNHEVGEFKCNHCEKIFQRDSQLKCHFDNVHNKTMKKCDLCEQVLLATNLKNHVKNMHTKQSQVKCDKCDIMFKKDHAFRKHLSERHCKQCGETFASNYEKKVHRNLYHGENLQLTYECQKCDKSYKEIHTLNEHVDLVHYKIKKHQCDICQKKFTRPYLLENHIQSAHKKL